MIAYMLSDSYKQDCTSTSRLEKWERTTKRGRTAARPVFPPYEPADSMQLDIYVMLNIQYIPFRPSSHLHFRC